MKVRYVCLGPVVAAFGISTAALFAVGPNNCRITTPYQCGLWLDPFPSTACTRTCTWNRDQFETNEQWIASCGKAYTYHLIPNCDFPYASGAKQCGDDPAQEVACYTTFRCVPNPEASINNCVLDYGMMIDTPCAKDLQSGQVTKATKKVLTNVCPEPEMG
jgi:hypothetical protein